MLLQTIGAHQRGRPIHFIEIADFFRDVDVGVGVVQLLLHQFLAEHVAEFFSRHRLERAGVEQRRGLVFHARTLYHCFGSSASLR